MIEAKVKNGLMIKKKDIDNSSLERIKQDLTVKDERSDEDKSRFYFEDNKYLYLPKLSFNMTNFTGDYVRKNIISKEDNTLKYYGHDFKYNMNISPKNEIQIETMDFLMNNTSSDKSLFLSPGTGKALRDDQLVLTNSGWKAISKLSYYDKVIGSDGQPKNIIGIFPQGIKEIYEVVFEDDTKSYCSGDHLWTVDVDDGSKDKTYNTLEMINLINNGKILSIKSISNPVTLELDYYDNGLFAQSLEDGMLLPNMVLNKSPKERMVIVEYFYRKSLAYLESFTDVSVPNFDINKDIVTDNHHVAQSLMFILRSMGEKVSLFELLVQNRSIENSNKMIFHIHRIGNRAKIVQINKVADASCTCIKIDSPDELFVTNDFILTHNTAMSIMYFVNKGLKPLIVLPDKNLMRQWEESILQFTDIPEDKIFKFDNGSTSLKKKECNDDKSVFLCCIQTLNSLINNSFESNEYLSLHKEIIDRLKIDIKIIDECHLNLSAINKSNIWLPTKENLYLSGTMNRRLVQENNIHPGIVEPNNVIESTEYEIKPQLMAIFYNSKPLSKNVYYCQDMAVNSGLDYNRYFNNYLLSEKNKEKLKVYLDMIENMCNYYINVDKKENYEHKIVIVAITTKSLDVLYDHLSQKYRVKRMYGKYKEKPENNDFDIIIGTNKMLTAGFDHKYLDVMISLFMNTSAHNIKQLIGRIVRSAPNKESAHYVCLIDSGFSMMLKYYNKHKEICENQISAKYKYEFMTKQSKYVFPYIEDRKNKNEN